jgi:hypothetical protein
VEIYECIGNVHALMSSDRKSHNFADLILEEIGGRDGALVNEMFILPLIVFCDTAKPHV